MFFNPNTLIHVLHQQSKINDIYAQRFDVRDELDALYYEVIHNLVLEVTRIGIEVKNLKMRVESMSSRLDFDERRARALEGVVQYRPGTVGARDRTRDQPAAASAGAAPAGPAGAATGGEEGQPGMAARRRRRRRRGRRGRGGTPPPADAVKASGPGQAASESAGGESSKSEPSSDSGDDGTNGGPSPSDL